MAVLDFDLNYLDLFSFKFNIYTLEFSINFTASCTNACRCDSSI